LIHQFRGSIAGILGAFADSARTMDETVGAGAVRRRAGLCAAEWVKPAEGGVERLMNVYVSMGVTPPLSLPKQAKRALAKPAKKPSS
jgi:hypothetical protein